MPSSDLGFENDLRFSAVLAQGVHEYPVEAVINTIGGVSFLSEATVAKYGLKCMALQEAIRVPNHDIFVTKELKLLLFAKVCWAPIHMYVLPDELLEDSLAVIGVDWLQEIEAVIDFKAMTMLFECEKGMTHTVEMDDLDVCTQHVDSSTDITLGHVCGPASEDDVSAITRPETRDESSREVNSSISVKDSTRVPTQSQKGIVSDPSSQLLLDR